MCPVLPALAVQPVSEVAAWQVLTQEHAVLGRLQACPCVPKLKNGILIQS